MAAERGADLVELRIDTFTDDPAEVGSLVGDCPLPCIVTCRAEWEGGHFDRGEQLRLALMAAACESQAAYIDVELVAFEKDNRWAELAERYAETTGLILSSHDFNGRPSDLYQRVERMANTGLCRIIKIVWTARSLRDNLQAMELLAEQHKPTIALCMGPFGQASRVLAGKFGGMLTFAGLDDESATAPGQVGVSKLKSSFRWDAVGRDTRVYGVIGWPVEHSMSPLMHNCGFDEIGFDGVYLPLPIPPEYEHFKASMGAWLDYEPLRFSGASVTLPHKENLIRFVDESGGDVEPLARSIGAANTLVVRSDGSLYAANTDYAAAIDALCQTMGIAREGLSGRRAAVIGAGGVSRAIAAGLSHYGAAVTIYNRTVERAENLARALSASSQTVVTAAPLDALMREPSDIIVNCTPLGMHPDVENTPLPTVPDWVGGQTVVFDTIYNPIQTRLLRDAIERGALTVSGLDMFVGQGAAQLEMWTSRSAPIATYRRVVREKLG